MQKKLEACEDCYLAELTIVMHADGFTRSYFAFQGGAAFWCKGGYRACDNDAIIATINWLRENVHDWDWAETMSKPLDLTDLLDGVMETLDAAT